jgi:hypothetical protein
MNVKPLVLLAFAAGLLLVSAPIFAPIFAHHGAASYDSKKLTTLKGTVTEFRFMNPHTEILFDVTDAAGNVQKWVAEANSIAALSRDGWTKNTVKPGDQIAITGNLAKNGSHTTRLSKILLPNGKELTVERGEDYAE